MSSTLYTAGPCEIRVGREGGGSMGDKGGKKDKAKASKQKDTAKSAKKK